MPSAISVLIASFNTIQNHLKDKISVENADKYTCSV